MDTTNNNDGCYGIQPHTCNAGQETLGFFRQNGEDFTVVFFSREQGKNILDRFASCFKPGKQDEVWEQIDDPEFLPEYSPHEPIIIGGTAGNTFCRHYQNYQRFAPTDNREHGYDGMGPRVIAYLYPVIFHAEQKGHPKNTIIAIKDGNGKYHVYIVFSDHEAERVLSLYPEVNIDISSYRKLMELSPLPASNLPTIYIGGERGGVAAYDLSRFIEVPRWLGHGLDGKMITTTSA